MKDQKQSKPSRNDLGPEEPYSVHVTSQMSELSEVMRQSIESPGGGGGGGGAGNGRAMWGLSCLVHQNAATQDGDKTNQ